MCRQLKASATLDEQGTLTVSIEGLGDGEVRQIHLWDMDIGGDAYYLPENFPEATEALQEGGA